MEKLVFYILKDECFYGGATHHGSRLPLCAFSHYQINLRKTSAGNQSAPLFLSTKGRYIWSPSPFTIKVCKGKIKCWGDSPISLCNAGTNLRDAYHAACAAHFHPTGSLPDALFFQKAQFNTWVELTYNHNQKSIMEYANDIVKAGFSPGILMIDDSWQTDYGVWEFCPDRFPNPKQMIQELHELGFKVMLWIVPYLSPKSQEYPQRHTDIESLYRNKKGKPVMIRWWNGRSYTLDLRKPADIQYMDIALYKLIHEYGIDGFKFDGGNIRDYIKSGINSKDAIALNQAYFTYAARFKFSEAKDTFGLAELPLVQRLRDKRHSWRLDGINKIVPDAINASLLGYRFLCPDMIGGGEYHAFQRKKHISEELVVRYAECSALFPMMQFSVNPMRILSKENLKKVLELAKLHESFGDYIYNLAITAANSGEPILKPLCYYDPEGGYEKVTDEFMLGDDILSAPIVKKGRTQRTVMLPKGRWKYIDGKVYEGRQNITVNAELGSLPYFIRKNKSLKELP